MHLPRIKSSREISPGRLLLVGPACGVLLAGVLMLPLFFLLPQLPHTASAQEPDPFCGDGACDPDEDWSWCASDCLTTCDGANWCTEGIGESPAACPDYTPYDGWVYAPGSPACSTSGCCVAIDPPDDTPPVTIASLNGTLGNAPWYTTPVTVTLSAGDDFSGIALTYLDYMDYTGPVTYTTEGETTITWQSIDNAGNAEMPQSLTFGVDTLAPVSTITSPAQNSWVGGVVTLSGYSMDETSGVAGAEVSFDSGATWQLASGSETWSYSWDTLALPVNMIQVRGIDVAGNAEEPIILAVSIDHSNPFFDVGPFPSEYCFCSGPLTFTLTAFDEQSGIANSAIVVKQNGQDIRVLQAPDGELRGTPVVWDGRDAQGRLVPVGDYQLLFYVANRAGLFGSFGANFRVVDTLPAGGIVPTAASLLPASPPDYTPWIITPNPPATAQPNPPFANASGLMPAGANNTQRTQSQSQTVQSQPERYLKATATVSSGNAVPTGSGTGTGAGLGALLTAAAAYMVAQQARTKKVATPTSETRVVQEGTKTVVEKVAKYSTTTVQDGWKTIIERIPVLEKVQQGWKTIIERVPRYIVQTVQEGVKTITERIPRYVTKTIQVGWKTIVEPVREFVSRTIIEPVRRWVPWLGWVMDTVKKTVVEPVTRFVTRTVPNYVTKVVRDGWDFVTKTVPNYVTRKFQAGWDFVTKTVPNIVVRTSWNLVKRLVPNMVIKKVQIGWDFVTKTVPNLVTKVVQSLEWKIIVPVGLGLGAAAASLTACPQAQVTPTSQPTSVSQTSTAVQPTQLPTSTPLAPGAYDTQADLWQLFNLVAAQQGVDATTAGNCQLPANHETPECKPIFDAMYAWQNQYNGDIINAVMNSSWATDETGLSLDYLVRVLKRLVLNESQFNPTLVTGNDDTGLVQIGLDTILQLQNIGTLPGGGPGTSLPPPDLTDPYTNLSLGAVNLYANYQGIQDQDEHNGWNMTPEDRLKLAVAMHNMGSNTSSLTVPDYWTPIRAEIVHGNYGACNDPGSWECIKIALQTNGVPCVAAYVDSIFDPNLSGAPYNCQ